MYWHREFPVTAISLVISDVDGTLVTPDKQLTPASVRAAQQLDEKGIGFTVVTARPPIGLRMLVEPLALRLPMGAFSGSAIVEPRFIPLLDRIGQALKAEQGNVQVIGYTDNQPIHNVQFPSNFQLSVARAEAAKNVLGATVGDASRLAAEGRGEADPIASNATLEGREQNRRIEFVLHRPSATP